MKGHLKRFGIGAGVMAFMNIVYSANARGVVNVTACVCCAIAGGLATSIGYIQFMKYKGKGENEETKQDKILKKEDESKED